MLVLCLLPSLIVVLCDIVLENAVADPEGGLWGLQPPLIKKKKCGHQHGRCDRFSCHIYLFIYLLKYIYTE